MRKIIAFILVYGLCSTSIFAEDKAFVVNPTTIRTQLFENNISLMQALNNVQNSKLNVSMARAKLLPALNLGALLPALANPTFLISSVTFLFPFLVPSNWGVLKEEKALFESDKASYKALELNVLSNSLTLYHTYMNDQKIQNAYQVQSDLLGRLYTALKKQSDVLGNVTPEDLGMAFSQWQDSKISVSKLQELLLEEKANIRSLLGLSFQTEINFEDSELSPSEYEGKSVGEIADHALEIAPEASQLNFLVKAAQAGKFAKMFGFMSTASISGLSINSASPFDALKAGGAFSFGADNLVNIKIANNNLAAIALREDQLKEENEKAVDVLVGKMVELNDQQTLARNSLNSRIKVFEGQKRQYDLGLLSLQTLLQTESQLTISKVNALTTDFNLKMQRLTLLRLVIDGDFSKVKGCVGEAPAKKKGWRHWFHKKAKAQSLDQICKG